MTFFWWFRIHFAICASSLTIRPSQLSVARLSHPPALTSLGIPKT